jgi:hypothetical protein
MKPGSGSFNGPETMSYEFRGATANGMLVFLAAWSGGASGTFYYLHILDAASNRAFAEDGSTYSRLDLTLVGSYGRCHGNVFLLIITHPPAKAAVCDSNRLALRSERVEQPLLARCDNALGPAPVTARNPRACQIGLTSAG